ncbi:MAG: hypothetical protein Kow00123_11760 [Anaerolineales bacterium]
MVIVCSYTRTSGGGLGVGLGTWVGVAGAAVCVAVATGVLVGDGATVGCGVVAGGGVRLGPVPCATVCVGATAGGVVFAPQQPPQSSPRLASPMATIHVFTGALYPAPARPSTGFDNEAAATL